MTRILLQWRRLLPAGAVVAVVSLVSIVLMQLWGGPERLRALVISMGVWAPLAYVSLKALAYIIAPLSGSPLIITAGTMFGLWPALALTVIGEVVGACANFWIARLLGRPGIRRFAGPEAVKEVDDAVTHVGGWRALLFASVFLSPFMIL